MKLEVASPCPESWECMRGDGRVRFCDRCELNVYNLSEMTEAEVEALVHGTTGRLCARFYRRRDGTVLTRDCPVKVRARIMRRWIVVAVALLSVVGAAMLFGRGVPTEFFPDWFANVLEELGIRERGLTVESGATLGWVVTP